MSQFCSQFFFRDEKSYSLPFQTVRLYEIDDGGGNKTEAKAKFDHRAAVLACSFSADARHAFSGGLDTVVKEYVR